MSLKTRHLNCGTMCPMCRRLVNGDGSLLESARLVCHCLLIETPRDGVVLVDTGMGQQCLSDARMFGSLFVNAVRPKLELHETAL